MTEPLPHIDGNTPTRTLLAELPTTSEASRMTTRELCAQAEYLRRNTADRRFPAYVVEELIRRVQILTEAMGPGSNPPPYVGEKGGDSHG